MKNERKRTFLLITIPILALFVCFNTIPLIRGVIYSFTNFKGFGNYDWVGLRNYLDLFTDIRVGKSYWFTFKLAVVTTIVVNVISLLLALALNSKIRAKSFFRGAYFLPNILGALVVGYIFNSGARRNGWNRCSEIKYFVKSEHRMAWNYDCLCMAGDCYEYDYLYFRIADCSRGCI